MSLQAGFYFGSILAAIALTGFLAWQAWRQDSVPGSRFYLWLAAAMCLAAQEEAFSMLAPNAAVALFWFKMRFLPLAAIPPLWLLFVLEYDRKRSWVTRGLIAGLFFLPLVFQLLVWVPGLNEYWVAQEAGFNQHGPFWVADITQRIPAVGYLLYGLVNLALMSAISVLWLRIAWRNRREYRLQAGFQFVSALLTVFLIVITTFKLLPAGAFNPTIPFMVLAALLAAVAVFRFDFLKRSPAVSNELEPQARAEEKRSLAYFLLLFALIAAGISAIGIVSYQNYAAKFRQQVESQLQSIADLKIKGLTAWRDERLADGRVLQTDPAFSELVTAIFENPADAASAGTLQAWLDSLRTNYHYVGIRLLDVNGVQHIASPTNAGPAPSDLNKDIAPTLATGEIFFQDFHRHENGKIYLGMWKGRIIAAKLLSAR
jgi:hypothetical protein